MGKTITFENIKAYKHRRMNEGDAFGGDYTIEVQADGMKARVKSNNFFIQLANEGVSRLNKLNRVGQYGSDAHCSIIVNGVLVFFKLPEFYKLITSITYKELTNM